jgi:hypothetical protein
VTLLMWLTIGGGIGTAVMVLLGDAAGALILLALTAIFAAGLIAGSLAGAA